MISALPGAAAEALLQDPLALLVTSLLAQQVGEVGVGRHEARMQPDAVGEPGLGIGQAATVAVEVGECDQALGAIEQASLCAAS